MLLMFCYVFLIEYDGFFFVGWQVQVDQFSVQGVIEFVLVWLDFGFCDGVWIVVVGWMDVGVYVLGQVVYVDLQCDWDFFCLFEVLNWYLKFVFVVILVVVWVDEVFYV